MTFCNTSSLTAGGPAEKGGLQQGDKILEWCGVSLVDRSFEEVCSIMSFSESEKSFNFT